MGYKSHEHKEVMYNYFVSSLNINTHPLSGKKENAKLLYYAILEHFINSCMLDAEYANARLSQYRSFLVSNETIKPLTDKNCAKVIRTVIDDSLKPWRRKYCFTLLCDIALIVFNPSTVEKVCGIMSKYISKRKLAKINLLLATLYSNNAIPPLFACVENLITQFRINYEFAARQEMRIIVTANISAGKSTLINALIGKPITRTAQEACTANLCFLYNKPFEDDRIHLLASPLNLNATYDDLLNIKKEAVCSIASYFRTSENPIARVCLIDTPGVNSALNSNHRKLTYKAIIEENYDKLIYVLNANMLGTEDELEHLKFIRRNVSNDKIIFVINKLDCFKSSEDSISASINDVKTDLLKIGFENPLICPLSAYFSLLLKMKQNNEILNEDEQDVFDYYVKKFNKPEYNLSKYHSRTLDDIIYNGDDLMDLSYISGLYHLENILYGGNKK